MGMNNRSLGTRTRAAARGSVAALGLAALLISGLPPLADTSAAAAEPPPPLAGEAPSNALPDSVYEPPAERPEPPDLPEPERPDPESAAGEALAAAEALDSADVEAISEGLAHDSVPSSVSDAVGIPLEGAADEALSAAAQEEADKKEAPEEAEPGKDPVAGEDPAPHDIDTEAPTAERDVARTTSADASTAAADAGCTQLPGVSYQGYFSFESMVSPVWNNRAGSYRVRVTNTGTQSWPAGSSVSYQVFDSAQNPVPGTRPATSIPLAAGANGGWVAFDAVVGSLAPATWLLAWDIFVPGVGWLSAQGNCSSNLQLTVSNQPPSLTYQAPASPGTVTTRTPFLRVAGADPDAWPAQPSLGYRFTVCTNAQLTTGCTVSSLQSTTTWQAPALQWGGQYYWAATVTDGPATTSGHSAVQSFRVVIPETDPWRQVGNGLGLADNFGVILPYGVFLHRARDLETASGDVPLVIDRTYSSGASQTEGAFGMGWISLFDARIVRDQASGLFTVTYPDGRQERFGQDTSGQWISRADLGATNRVIEHSTTTTTVRQISGEIVTFDTPTGRLRKVEFEGRGAWELTYTNGVVSRITQRPTGQYIDVEWSNVGPTCDPYYRPTRPYVSAMSTDRGDGQAPVRWTYAYSCNRLTAVTDPTGGVHRYNSTTTTFTGTTPEGRAIRGLNTAGAWRTFTNDRQERVVEVIEPGSIKRSIRLVRPLAGWEDYYRSTYNSFNGVTAIYCAYRENRNGSEYCFDNFDTLEFDTSNRLRVKAKREGGTGPGTGTRRTWQYSAVNGRLTSMIDENWNVVSYSYDGYGNPTTSYVFRGNEQITSQSYYRPEDGTPTGPNRLRGSTITPTQAGQTVPGSEFIDRYTYDAQGRLLADDGPTVPGHPDGEQRSFSYTTGSESAINGDGTAITGKTMPPGLLRQEVTAAGTATRSYDERGNLTRVDEPGGGSVRRTFDARGYVVREVVNGTARADYSRDALGRVTLEKHTCSLNEVTGEGSQLIVERIYDRDGLPKTVTERAVDCSTAKDVASPRTTSYAYTAEGRLAQTTDAVGGVTKRSYSATNPDQIVQEIDARGRVTTYDYNVATGHLYRVMKDVGVAGATSRVEVSWYQYDLAGRRTWELDALRRDLTTDYTDDGYPAKATRSDVVVDGIRRAVTLWERKYDGAGNVTEEVLAGQRKTTHIYDALSRPVSSTLDPGGLARTTTVTRDAAGRTVGTTLTSAAEPRFENKVTSQLNAAGFSTSESAWLADGTELRTQFVRDVWGNAQRMGMPNAFGESASGHWVHAGRDAMGRVTWTTESRSVDIPQVDTGDDAYGQFRTYSSAATDLLGYNAFGEITHVEDPGGHMTTFVHDAAGRVIETHLPDYTPEGGTLVDAVLHTKYNAAGDVVEKRDGRGGVTSFQYDVAGNLVEERAPSVQGVRAVKQYKYDAADQLVEDVDPLGVRTVHAYDSLGREIATTVKKRTDPTNPSSPTVDHTTSYGYDAIGNITSVTTPAGRKTRYEFNAAGEVTATWKPERTQPTRIWYDPAGRVIRELDGAGRGIERVFDRAGREIETAEVGSDGSRLVTQKKYDRSGNLIQQIDPRGFSTHYTYAPDDRVTSVSQELGGGQTIDTEVGYDRTGNIARVRNGNGVDTWYVTNAWGLREKTIEAKTERHPALGDRSWTDLYDRSGNLVSRRQPGGTIITTTFDSMNRATSVSGGGVSSAVTYDSGNRVTSATPSSGSSTTLVWNDLDQIVTSQHASVTQRLAYDADGLLVQNFMGDSWYGNVQYSRFGDGSLRDVWKGAAGTGSQWNFEYDAATGDRTRMTFDSGAATTWMRDPFGKLSRKQTTSGTGQLTQDVSYEYDQNGNVQSKTSLTEPQAGGAFTYDGANRLTAWMPRDSDGTLGRIYSRHYEWDGAGNRTRESINVTSRTWRFDERNRPESVVYEDDVLPQETTTGVSARGDVTQIGSRTLQHDGLGRLTRDGTVQYNYDGFGRLSERRGPADKWSTKDFQYVGVERNPIVARDVFGSPESALRDDEGELLGTTYSGPTASRHLRSALTDGRGDVTGAIETSGPDEGSRTGSVGWDPFGQRERGARPDGAGADKSSVFGFQSAYSDPHSAAVYMGSRWYEPSTGTFLSRDMADLPDLSSGAQNRYSYADGNPVTNVDPTGEYAMVAQAFRMRLAMGLTERTAVQSMSMFADEETVAEYVAVRTIAGMAVRMGLRVIPVIGWFYLGWEIGSMLSGLGGPAIEGPGGGGRGFIDEVVEQPPPPQDKPVTSRTSTSDSWANEGREYHVANIGGRRVVTTTFMADLMRTTRTDRSDGSWNWQRDFIGRYATGSLTETFGRVIDPSRVDQSHTTPTLTQQELVTRTTAAEASDAGECGLSGTVMSCLTGDSPLVESCASPTALARVCTPLDAVPGASGGTGPAAAAGQGADGGGGPGGPSVGGAGEDCVPDPALPGEESAVVYLRTDPRGELKDYVGRSKSPERYDLRQGEHNRKHGVNFRYEILQDVPSSQLRTWEQYFIDQFGGPTNMSNPDGGLSNKRNEMNARDYENPCE